MPAVVNGKIFPFLVELAVGEEFRHHHGGKRQALGNLHLPLVDQTPARLLGIGAGFGGFLSALRPSWTLKCGHQERDENTS